MIDGFHTLVTLYEQGTMSRAATILRVTQSTVSKRMQQLESLLGKQLVEKNGRYISFTNEGIRIVCKAKELLSTYREILHEESNLLRGSIIIGVGHSLLSSWGADALSYVKRQNPEMELHINSHRGKIALDRVSSGEYMLGFVPGKGELNPDLHVEIICEEQMVIIPSSLKAFRPPKFGKIELLSSEQTETTWSSIKKEVRRYRKATGIRLDVKNTIQTFTAAAKLAEAGFGHAFVPEGVAKSFGFSKKQIVYLPNGGIKRSVSIIGRKTILLKPIISKFISCLKSYTNTSTKIKI